jgi:transcription antitermination factor NusG
VLLRDMPANPVPEPDSQQADWYAIQVRSRHEFSTAAILYNKGYRPFVPQYRSQRRWSDRRVELELPLFPGYIFCEFNVKARMPILTTAGVLRIVGTGKMPLPVEVHHIEAVRRVMQSGYRAKPYPFVAVGSRVRIEEGPLSGLEGIVQGNRNQLLILSIEMIQQSILVDLNHVIPLKTMISGRSLGN